MTLRYQAAVPEFAPERGSPDPPVQGGFGRICERAAVYAGTADGAATPRWLSSPAALKTYVATPLDRERNWVLVDAEGKTLGRLATQIADTLRGKRKPTYTPHVDVGDFVVVVNAEKVSVSGKKREEKLYHRHSGYPGGLRTRSLQEQLDRRPTEVLRAAVKGMLPRTRLGRAQITKLKIYAGPEHPHEAQAPKPLPLQKETV